MAELKFMKEMPLDSKLFRCPHCGEGERIGVHSRSERLLKCHGCGKCFGETKGTVFENLQYPKWVVILVLSLIGHGCPICAIVACFFIDSRTVEAWHEKAGAQGKQVQEQIVCNGQVELGQVQADELRVKTQKGTVRASQKSYTKSECDIFAIESDLKNHKGLRSKSKARWGEAEKRRI